MEPTQKERETMTSQTKKIAYAEKKTAGIYDVTYPNSRDLDRDVGNGYLRRLERLGYEIVYANATDD
jgi:hypothetical protein